MLEASGVAEPMGIARTFTAPAYRGRIRLDGIVAVVDAEQLPHQAADPTTRDLVFGQIGFSDMVVLNKIDLAERARVDEVRSFVLDRLPAVRIIETVRADVPFDVLIGSGPANPPDDRWVGTHDHRHDSEGHGFTTWVYRREDPFDLAALEEAAKRLPRSVYRVKGFVHGADEPEYRHLLQVVGLRADVQPYDSWGDRRPTTELVVIADSSLVDRGEVEALLDGCRPTASR